MELNRAKGLNSLLADSEVVVKQKIAAFKGVREIELNKIEAGKSQPRFDFEDESLQELADSIVEHGVIQPITIREISTEKYEIISGERRYRAAKNVGLTVIPAFIRDVNDQQSLEMALIENIQRENLNPIEVALSFQRMISECNLKQEELSKRVGKSRSTVTNILRLLNLPTEIQSGLILGVISIGQAKPLITLKDKNKQIDIYQKILDEDLNTRSVEALVKKGNEFEAEANELDRYKEDMRIEELELRSKTVVPIKLKIQDFDKGNVTISFSNEEELQDILEKIQN